MLRYSRISKTCVITLLALTIGGCNQNEQANTTINKSETQLTEANRQREIALSEKRKADDAIKEALIAREECEKKYYELKKEYAELEKRFVEIRHYEEKHENEMAALRAEIADLQTQLKLAKENTAVAENERLLAEAAKKVAQLELKEVEAVLEKLKADAKTNEKAAPIIEAEEGKEK